MLAIGVGELETTRLCLPDGRHIDITLVQIRGDNVRLAFDAPKDVVILRHDVRLKTEQAAKQKEAAARG